MAAAQSATCHPVSHLGHSLFPPSMSWCQWVLWAKSCATLILFDLCALPGFPQRLTWPGAPTVHQAEVATRSVQTLVPPHTTRLPLMAAGPWVAGAAGGFGCQFGSRKQLCCSYFSTKNEKIPRRRNRHSSHGFQRHKSLLTFEDNNSEDITTQQVCKLLANSY